MRKNLYKIIIECLTEVYQHTSPAVDLSWIIESGEGKRRGWFEEYTIPEVVFEDILRKFISKYKLAGIDLQRFRAEMYLGPSPRFI